MEQRKRNKSQLILTIIVSFIILITIFLNLYMYKAKEEKIKNEQIQIEEFINQPSKEHSKNYKENNQNEEKKDNKIKYSSVIEIPKIGLKKGLYDINSKYNNISYNIQILSDSDMPDVNRGNFILAGHNGNSSISYFDKLDKLSLGDSIYIYYDGIKYEYLLDNYYTIDKTGIANIVRDYGKSTITLITCKRGTKDKQMIFIGYLKNKSNY